MSGLVHEFEKLDTAIKHLFNWANSCGYEVIVANAFPLRIITRDCNGAERGSVTGVPRREASVR